MILAFLYQKIVFPYSVTFQNFLSLSVYMHDSRRLHVQMIYDAINVVVILASLYFVFN